MKNKLFVTLGILGMSMLTYASPKHSQETSYPSYKGLIMQDTKVGFAARRMEPIKAMAIMGPESYLMRNIALSTHGPMSVNMKRPMRRLSSMPMEERHVYSVQRTSLLSTCTSSG